MAKFSVIALTLLVSCVPMMVAPEIRMQEEGSQPGSLLYSPFNPWVMDVEADGYYGKAFIANSRIYSARHIHDRDYSTLKGNGPTDGNDVIDLGPADIRGYDICKDCKHNEVFFMRKKDQVIFLECMREEEPNKLWMWASQEIKEGDSGSPILCMKHYKVVGLLSCFKIANHFTLLITKIP